MFDMPDRAYGQGRRLRRRVMNPAKGLWPSVSGWSGWYAARTETNYDILPLTSAGRTSRYGRPRTLVRPLGAATMGGDSTYDRRIGLSLPPQRQLDNYLSQFAEKQVDGKYLGLYDGERRFGRVFA